MSQLDLQRDDGPTGGRYIATLEGHTAEMTYSQADATRIIIDHAGVPDALRGKSAVEDARTAGIKIIPLCPFAKAQIEKHPEWHDVRA